MTELSEYCFIDLTYYNSMLLDNPDEQIDETTETDKVEKFNIICNYVTSFFENFTKRLLKERQYSYDILDTTSFNPPELAIFDGVKGFVFWFPNYPVNLLSEFIISDVLINEATDYLDTSGYTLFKSSGKLKYLGGFDFGYFNNIKCKYTAGYSETSNNSDYKLLQYLTYQAVNQLMNTEPSDSLILSETLGSYKYTNKTISSDKSLIISNDIINLLSPYKRISFA